MWELDHKESYVPNNWYFWTVVWRRFSESSLDYMEIQPVHPKGNQPLMLIGRTGVEAETPILWPPDGKSWLIGKDPDAGKDWGREKKGTTEDEMVGCHHRLDGHEFGWTLGGGDGQGGLVRCSPWGRKRVGRDLATKQPQQMYVQCGSYKRTESKNNETRWIPTPKWLPQGTLHNVSLQIFSSRANTSLHRENHVALWSPFFSLNHIHLFISIKFYSPIPLSGTWSHTS